MEIRERCERRPAPRSTRGDSATSCGELSTLPLGLDLLLEVLEPLAETEGRAHDEVLGERRRAKAVLSKGVREAKR
jgi:hypothetical protein